MLEERVAGLETGCRTQTPSELSLSQCFIGLFGRRMIDDGASLSSKRTRICMPDRKLTSITITTSDIRRNEFARCSTRGGDLIARR